MDKEDTAPQAAPKASQGGGMENDAPRPSAAPGEPPHWRDLPPELYGELRGVAGRLMAQERPGHTLSPTALLHEAWLKLDQGQPRLADRRHVFALAARVMRHLLVDHALARQASKRGDGLEPVTLSAAELLGDEGRGDPAELLAVHQALERLSQEDARCAQVMELRGFGGLSLEEIGAELGISLATVKREWVYGRAWMARALGAGA